jgi:chromosomal replication initiator protein
MVDGVIDIPLPGRLIETAPVDAASCRVAGQADAPTTRQDAASTFASHFLAGPENRLVEVAVRSVIEQPPNGYNPLVLYGPSGTGKSHLAHGLAAAWKDRLRRPDTASDNDNVLPTLRVRKPPHAEREEYNTHQRVVCTTAVDFARELAEAIETQGVEEFRAKHRGAALLVVEDLGMLATRKAGKLSAQEEFIHTLDALLAEDRWVIVTASAPPAELPDILPALQSRLLSGLTVPLAPPGPAARRAILRQLALLHKIYMPEPVSRLLAEGLSGTVPELAGSLLQLEMPARLRCARIEMDAAKQYLAERDRSRRPTLHEIALRTARHFSLRLADLRSPVRRRALVTARGVAVYLARRLTDESLDEIGAYFGGRDHTTVMHSCRRTEELMENDSAIRQAVELLRATLWKT